MVERFYQSQLRERIERFVYRIAFSDEWIMVSLTVFRPLHPPAISS